MQEAYSQRAAFLEGTTAKYAKFASVDLSQRVLYRDPMMLVLDKPAGLACVPSGPRPYLSDHLVQLTFGKTTLPQLAHRLDRETSGCLLLGRHPRALRQLGQLFQEHKIGKVYWALVRGHWPQELDLIEQPIEGKPASSKIKCLEHWEDCSWLELYPQTGRTHQLRLHCAQAGHPILGDSRYGGGSKGPLRLHSRQLTIPYFPKRPPVVVQADPPRDWPQPFRS